MLWLKMSNFSCQTNNKEVQSTSLFLYFCINMTYNIIFSYVLDKEKLVKNKKIICH